MRARRALAHSMFITAATLALTAAAAPSAVSRHPLHTTLAELTYDSTTRRAEISLRVFADDFAAAVARRARAASTTADAASYAYLTAALTLTDANGRALRLEWCGSRRSGDVLWFCLRAAAPRGLAGLRVVNRCLVELFADQVNILQARDRHRRYSLLFTRGDTVKSLPR